METMVWWNAVGGSLNKEVKWKFKERSRMETVV